MLTFVVFFNINYLVVYYGEVWNNKHGSVDLYK